MVRLFHLVEKVLMNFNKKESEVISFANSGGISDISEFSKDDVDEAFEIIDCLQQDTRENN